MSPGSVSPRSRPRRGRWTSRGGACRDGEVDLGGERRGRPGRDTGAVLVVNVAVVFGGAAALVLPFGHVGAAVPAGIIIAVAGVVAAACCSSPPLVRVVAKLRAGQRALVAAGRCCCVIARPPAGLPAVRQGRPGRAW